MPDAETEDRLREFWREHGPPGLLLPDGWFGGRPMENEHELTFLAARPKRLLIELDNQVLITLAGTELRITEVVTYHSLASGETTLELTGFSQAVVEYLGYVNDRPGLREYDRGTISLVGRRQPEPMG